MTWDLAGSWLIDEYDTLIPVVFNSRLAVKVSSVSGLKPTWNFAGYFYQMVDIPVVGLSRIDKKIATSIRDPIIFIPEQTYLPYQLKYRKADWIDSLILTIYEDPMSLYQSEPSVTPNPTDFTGQSAPALFALVATAVSVLPANPNRKGLTIRNKGNKVAYLGFAATVDANNAPYSIPGGTTLEETNDFPPGQLFMIAPAGNTEVVVMEIF